MGFIPVANTWQINVRGEMAGARRWENVFYIGGQSGVTLNQANADAVGDWIHDAWGSGSGLALALSNLWKIDDVVVTDLNASTSPQFTSTNAAITGGSGTDSLPPQVAGVVNWFTASRGRSFRGRTFLNGFQEGSSSEGPQAGILANIADWVTAMMDVTSVPNGSGFLAVVSRYSGTHLVPGPGGQLLRRPIPRTNGIATAITSGAADTVWKTQRRRNRV